MGDGGEELQEVDVIVADPQDICRAAAVSALRRLGFAYGNVHEVESQDQVLGELQALQTLSLDADLGAGPAQDRRRFPILVFLSISESTGVDCAQRLLELRGTFTRDLFLVCASARVVAPTSPERAFFHHAVPKTFEAIKLQECVEQFQEWWRSGCKLPGPPQESAAQEPDLEKVTSPRAPSPVDRLSYQKFASAGSFAAEHEPAEEPRAPAVAPPSTGGPSRDKGKSTDCLDSLQPARAPFEDVQLLRLIGKGSYGHVYRGRWGLSAVAVKVVEYMNQVENSVMAFEGALSKQLAHPNLVQTFKYSVRDMRQPTLRQAYEVWIVQEWCGLGTLFDRILRKPLLEHGGYPEIIETAGELASAACYLHGRNIIHGDMSAANVLLTERRCRKGYIVKVSDFGLSRVMDSMATGIDTGTMGTVAYMPPELFQLEGYKLTKKVDVYAFGVILWQLCTGKVPYQDLQPTQVVVMVAQGLSLQLPKEVPPPLASVFKQATMRQKEARPEFDSIMRSIVALSDQANPPLAPA